MKKPKFRTILLSALVVLLAAGVGTQAVFLYYLKTQIDTVQTEGLDGVLGSLLDEIDTSGGAGSLGLSGGQGPTGEDGPGPALPSQPEVAALLDELLSLQQDLQKGSGDSALGLGSLDSLLDELEGRGRQEQRPAADSSPAAPGPFRPRADVLEKDGKYVVLMDLPGVKLEQVETKIERNMVTVAGKRQTVAGPVRASERGPDFMPRERPSGAFRRSVLLPKPVKPESLDVAMADGVLTITLEPEPVANQSHHQRPRNGQRTRTERVRGAPSDA